MKISRIVIRFWWFIILLIVAGYLLLSNIAENRRIDRETGFAIEDTDDITRIALSKDDRQIVLERTNTNGWLVNYETPASDDAINALLRVISRLQPSGPVPTSANDSLLHFVREEGVRVEFFSNRRQLRSFSIASAPSHRLQNIGHIENAHRVYILSLPRYEGVIADLFNTIPDYWIGNQVPMPSSESIVAVQVEMPADLEQSFRIDVVGTEQYRLFHIYTGSELDGFDVGKISTFLGNLSQIPFASIVTMNEEERAAVIYSEPDFIYTVYTSNDASFELNVYPIPVEEYIDELGRPINVDLNRVYVTVSGNQQVFMVNYIDLHKVLQGLSSFIS